MSLNIERIKEKSMESGYYYVDLSNVSDILGSATEDKNNDEVFIDILNPLQSKNAHAVSPSMVINETDPEEVDQLIADLAHMALGPSYGQSRMWYIDMRQSVASRSTASRVERRIEGLSDVRPTTLARVILVNAGVEFEQHRNPVRAIERASALTQSLGSLPETTFRVGMIASPEFVEAIGLGENASEVAEPKTDRVSGRTTQPAAVTA